jgi:hypothetical protein
MLSFSEVLRSAAQLSLSNGSLVLSVKPSFFNRSISASIALGTAGCGRWLKILLSRCVVSIAVLLDLLAI